MEFVMKRLALALSVMAATTGTALAHDTRSLEREMARQVFDIKVARRDGDLTYFEYRGLLRKQSHVSNLLRQVHADGVVTAREYYKVKRAQRQARRAFFAEANDEQYSRVRRWLAKYR
jgi:hypothetical protein